MRIKTKTNILTSKSKNNNTEHEHKKEKRRRRRRSSCVPYCRFEDLFIHTLPMGMGYYHYYDYGPMGLCDTMCAVCVCI